MNEILLEYIKKFNNCWIGIRPPYDIKTVDISKSTNFRLASVLHQQFEVVWLYEKLLDNYGVLSWKIVLDEAIRLLGKEGWLIIRTRKIGVVTAVELKNYLGRHIGISVFLEYELKEANETSCLVFRITRKNIECYKDNTWTFGILTTGSKKKNVIEFLKSIREKEERESEIIIAGPYDPDYEKYNVIYLDCSFIRPDMAEISKKKNAIADAATRANLMIVHDRFSLSNSFFSDFQEYGYDYDFLSVIQIGSNGDKLPAIAVHIRNENYGLQVIPKEWDKLFDGTYVNGGAMIFKTHILRQIRFNELLCWEQREDVELSERFIMNSIIPRINYISSINVLELREGYQFAFLEENELTAGMREALFFSSLEKNMYKRWYDFIEIINNERIYLFGAGVVTKKILKLLNDEQKEQIIGILVSDCDNNPSEIGGITVYSYEKCLYDEHKIIIGLLYSKQEEMKTVLNNWGIDDSRIVTINKEVNTALYYLYNKKVNEENNFWKE